MRLHLASALAAALLLAGSACATDDAPPVAAPIAASPVEAAAPTAEPAESAPVADYTVTVSEVAASGQLGDGKALAVSTRRGADEIAVHMENLVTYCAPAPAFSAQVAGDTLRLTLVKADNVSRCARPQRLVAVVPVSDEAITRVVIADPEGKELASAALGATECYVKGDDGQCFDTTEAACAALGCPTDQCACTEASSDNTCVCQAS